MGLPYPTVRKFLKEYAAAGYKLPDRRKNDVPVRGKITEEIATYLKDKKTLQEFAHYGLR